MARQHDSRYPSNRAIPSPSDMGSRFRSMELSALQERVLEMLGGLMDFAEEANPEPPSPDKIEILLLEVPVACQILFTRQRADAIERQRIEENTRRQAAELERQQTESLIQSLSVGQLERYVLTKKPYWQLAKQLLDRKRASGACDGHKSAQRSDTRT